MDMIKNIGMYALIIGISALFLGILARLRDQKAGNVGKGAKKNAKTIKNLPAVRKVSIEILQRIGINHFPESLPLYLDESANVLRSADQIFDRMMAVYLASNYASFLSVARDMSKEEAEKGKKDLRKFTNNMLERYGLHTAFTREEIRVFDKGFDYNNREDQKLAVNISWGVESALILAFVLGVIESPPKPNQMNTSDVIMQKVSELGKTRQEVMRKLEVATKATLHVWLDVYHVLNWYCNETALRGMKNNEVVPSVAIEGFRALAWLLDESKTSWYNNLLDK